ncbi:DUF6249 domain-containing protein [Paucibacter sp. DJ1R-11]|uniref:DUF6249 domain-containing protein n=1 Tax=Paucibacter sp. DJ1R-11 TaxID=2893556 RepID=UPI0021E45AD3|nr:DUF6249 domain-containing protein [Paucibacter sp. DJ1R-11]MCV2362817.1 DUF6249 domain-containing protein [Paucibacter sp. DJ1R-11]
MDFLDLRHIVPFLVPIVALLIPIVAIVMGVQSKMRRDQLLHETLRQLADKGQPLPPELLGQLGVDMGLRTQAPRVRAFNSLLGGAVNVALGLALALMFYAMQPGSWLWAIGCLPGFIGLALLLVWWVETRSEKNS